MVCIGVTTSDPLVALDPDHPPDAVRVPALMVDHVRVTDSPSRVLVGSAVRVTVGVAATAG